MSTTDSAEPIWTVGWHRHITCVTRSCRFLNQLANERQPKPVPGEVQQTGDTAHGQQHSTDAYSPNSWCGPMSFYEVKIGCALVRRRDTYRTSETQPTRAPEQWTTSQCYSQSQRRLKLVRFCLRTWMKLLFINTVGCDLFFKINFVI